MSLLCALPPCHVVGVFAAFVVVAEESAIGGAEDLRMGDISARRDSSLCLCLLFHVAVVVVVVCSGFFAVVFVVFIAKDALRSSSAVEPKQEERGEEAEGGELEGRRLWFNSTEEKSEEKKPVLSSIPSVSRPEELKA